MLLETIVAVVSALTAIVGLFVAYLAYRGYRRNDSRPMLFISLGFILALGVPFFLFVCAIVIVAVTGLPATLQAAVVAMGEVSQVVGLLVILYALRV